MENKLTPEELAIEAGKKYQKEIEDRIEAETKAGFLNPFGVGVNYEHFLKACKGKDNVQKYCEGKILQEQIDFLINDLKHYNPKSK